MIQYVDLALTWILFLALFPISFTWLRNAYRIFIRKDYSAVALKRGESPAQPKKYALTDGLFNLIGALILVGVVVGIVAFQLPYDSWTAMAGSTIISKIVANFALTWQAHKQRTKAKST